MNIFVQTILPVIIAVVASSGFWAFVQKLSERKDVRIQMLIGLGHDRIISLGMKYIERGYITDAEYENLNVYLYKPYSKIGGNGSAKRVMDEVNRLPIRKVTYESEKEGN